MLLACFVVMGVQARAQFFVTGPLVDSGSRTFTLNVTDDGIITDLDVRLSILHPNMHFLTVVLTSPLGTKVSLYNGLLVDSGANMQDTLLNDQAGNGAIGTGNPGSITLTAPFAGEFKPYESSVPGGPNKYHLSTFTGEQSAGTWTLRVSDNQPDLLIGQLYGENTGLTWGDGSPVLGTQLFLTTDPSPVPEPQQYATAAACLLLLYSAVHRARKRRKLAPCAAR